MEKRKCDECGELSQFVFMRVIDNYGCLKYMHLCEKCHNKYEKPFKKE